MRKLLATAFAGGLLTAGAWLIPANAATPTCTPPSGTSGSAGCTTDYGTISASGSATPTPNGDITADGADSNPGPAQGYITAGNGDGTANVCADDNGSPGASTAPTCVGQ